MAPGGRAYPASMSDGSSGAVERDKRAEARAAMVARQLRARGIADERVLLAMGQVPREEFVPAIPARPRLRRRGAADRGRPDDQPAVHGRPDDRAARRRGPATASSRSGPAPATRRRSSRCWAPGHDDRAPAGARGTRPGAARQAGARRRVEVRSATAASATPAGAPWDGIIVTAAAPSIPASLREQLRRRRPARDPGRDRAPPGPARWSRRQATSGSRKRRAMRVRAARRRGGLPGLGGGRRGRGRLVHSARHDPRLRRAASGRRRALVRRADREPPRARPERDDHHRLLGRRRRRRPQLVPARGARVRDEGDVAGRPRRSTGPTSARTTRSTRRTRCPRGPRPTTGSRRRRPTPTRPRSGSGSARRGTAGRASGPSRWPASRSSTTCRRRARS